MLVSLLKEFYNWKPGLIQMMKECSHHYSPDHLSPYHLENDNLTHTLMAYNQLIHLNIPNNKFRLLSGISVLCHDIGKIYTRHSPKPGKIAMYNHAFASIQDTIEFIQHLDNRDWFVDDFTINDVMYYVLTSISNHMDYMQLDRNDRYGPVINNDPNLKYISDVLLYCDLYGSISEQDDKEDINIKYQVFDVNILPNIVTVEDIILFCGPPASGKDYFAQFNNRSLLSYDDIRVQLYVETLNDSEEYCSLTYDELYRKSFEYCKDKNINLNNYLLKQLEQEIEKGNKVCICNTNLTRKSRRSIINIIKQNKQLKHCSISVVYLCCGREDLYDRDKNRDKSVGDNIIDKFVFNQQIPTKKEGVDNVLLINN